MKSEELKPIELTPVLSKYFPGLEEAEAKQVFQQNVVSVEIGDKQYVIKKHPASFRPERIDFVTRLQNFVVAEMGTSPLVIPTINGQLFVEIGDSVYDLTELVEGATLDSLEVINLEKFFFHLGSFVGSLHQSLASFDNEESPALDALLKINDQTSSHFEDLISDYRQHGVDQAWIDILHAKSSLADEYAFVLNSLTQLPKSIIHADIYADNLFFDGEQNVTGLIDFANAGMFFRCYEVIKTFIQINKHFNDLDINRNHLKFFLEGYNFTNQLTDIELDLMIDLYIYIQSADVSFLDSDIVKSGNETALYAKFRFDSLNMLHKMRDELQDTVNEVRKSEDSEVESLSFNLGSVLVTLESGSEEVMEICQEYFQMYSREEVGTDISEWTVVDKVDESVEEPIIIVNNAKKKVAIFRGEKQKKVAMRVIRSLMMYVDVNADKVMFKGAAYVNERGKGLILMGEPGAGKTSILLDSLLRPGQRSVFISNSLVSLEKKNGRTHAYGYPMAVGVRGAALKAMSENSSPHVLPFFNGLVANGFLDKDGRCHMDPAHLIDHFDRRIKADTGVDAIVFIKSIAYGEAATLEEVDPRDHVQFFEDYFLRYYDADEVGWYRTLGVRPPDQRALIPEIILNSKILLLSYPFGYLQEAVPLLDQI